MRIFWDRNDRSAPRAEWQPDWAATATELESGLPLHTGRALTWLSVAQAVIQGLGLLVIVYACLR
ncbi:hypothetical protein SAMN05421890_0473 [Ensifer adhaerens]|nr:hypothetical protein SAMN05421890_0473 [Ensifer adhaerens]HZG29637.1 hypothetical protein [Ensifer sp.]